MKRILVLCIPVLSHFSIYGQNVALTQFKDSIVPKTGKGDLYDINQSPNRFIVSSTRDSLQIKIAGKDYDTTTCQMMMTHGILEGHTLGSAGGYMLHLGRAENARPDTIFDRPVQNILGAHRTVYFSSSVWNPVQRYGHLYILDTTQSAFKSKLVAEFEYPIRQLCTVRDSLYLITGGKLYRFQYGKAVYITDIPFTCNSMAGYGRYLFFGMNGAYARLDMRTKQLRYFVYTGQ